MKLINKNSTLIILFFIVVLFMLVLKFTFNVYPVFDLMKYLESKEYYWVIPLTGVILSVLWLYGRIMERRIENERIEIFNATIRTIQDILQNSSSSIQLLILDMKDEGVNEEIILRAEKNIDELKSVIKALAAVDPKTIELKELKQNLSIIKMHEG